MNNFQQIPVFTVTVIYSEKTTKFCKISTIDLTVTKGESLSNALIFCRIWGEHVVYRNCSECQKQFLYTTYSPRTPQNMGRTCHVQNFFDIQNNFCTQHVLPMFFKNKIYLYLGQIKGRGFKKIVAFSEYFNFTL